MGLYNTLFGQRPMAPYLVQLIAAVQAFDPGRFRDGWIERDGDGGYVIRLHTRNGGGNRESMAEAITSMQTHPWFVTDEDLVYDTTYADFYFRAAPTDWLPQSVIDEMNETAVDHVDLDAVWEEAIDNLGKEP